MTYVVREIHSWACDIPNCREKLTGATSLYSEEKGWVAEDIFGQWFNLCPFHAEYLKGFLFNDDNRTADNSSV